MAIALVAAINSAVAWNWPLDQPLTPWRRRVVLVSKELLWITLGCLGFRIRVKGREYIRTGERLGAVGVFNHVSWVDAFVLVWLMAPSGVSKASNAKLPVIGHAVRALQTVYIPYDKLSKCRNQETAEQQGKVQANGAGYYSRHENGHDNACIGNGGGKRASNAANTTNAAFPNGKAAPPSGATAASTNGSQSSQAAATPPPVRHRRGATGFLVSSNVTEVLLRRVSSPSYCRPGGYPMVVMAPEGTTGNGRGLLQFRTGAFTLGRPVLPICLGYRWRGLNPAWTLGNPRWHFVRLMCQFRNDLEVEILPPYRPSEEELKNPKLYAANVRRLMASVLGVPRVEASHDDYLQLVRRGVDVSWDGRRVLLPAC